MTNPNPAAQPVAWLHSHPQYPRELEFFRITKHDALAGWTETPLYAHPPEIAQPVAADTLPNDHERGCEGRSYTCSCGYDDRIAAEITRLQAEVDRKNAALKPFAEEADAIEASYSMPLSDDVYRDVSLGQLRRARAALSPGGE